MWAQSWQYLSDYVKPYPNASGIDVTRAMNDQNYTVLKMFEMADEFYQSLGLLPNDICYNTTAGAVIEKPVGREMLCHASAWDFCDGENFRYNPQIVFGIDSSVPSLSISIFAPESFFGRI